MAEKILAFSPRGLPEVVPGQLIECDLDLVLANDITAPIAIKTVREIGAGVFDRDRSAWCPTTTAPTRTSRAPSRPRSRATSRTRWASRTTSSRAAWASSMPFSPSGHRRPGRPHHRRRLPHLHLRWHRCVLDRRWLHGCRRGHGDRRAWFKVPETIRFEIDGELPAGASCQGHHPLHHRPDRRRRRALLRHGVCRLHHPRPLG
jgi:3-isopropylmalate/(R)-2-methylmalate dehydratase large subunit